MPTKPSTDRPRPPSVEAVVKGLRAHADAVDPAALTAVARTVIDEERGRIATGESPRAIDVLTETARDRLQAFSGAGVEPVDSYMSPALTTTSRARPSIAVCSQA